MRRRGNRHVFGFLVSITSRGYTITGACQAGLSRSAIYREFKAGTLRAVKRGKRTLILEKDLRALLENSPALEAQAA